MNYSIQKHFWKISAVLLLAGASGLLAIERFQQQPGRFSAVDLKKNTVNLEDLKGKIVFATYWQVSCYPCRLELPRLNEFQREFSGKPVVFLTVNPWNRARQIKKFRDGANPTKKKLKNLRFLMKHSSGSVWGLPAAKNGYIGTPTTVILDQSGTVIGRAVGGMNLDEARGLIKSLLAGSNESDGKTEEQMEIIGRVRIRGLKQKGVYRAPAPNADIKPRTTGPAWKD